MFNFFRKRPEKQQKNEKDNLSGYEYLQSLRRDYQSSLNFTNKALKNNEEKNEK